MSFRVTAWVPVALLVLIAGVTLWLARTVTGVPPHEDGAKRHDPDMIVESFVAKQFGADGHVRHLLTATKMIHYPDDDSSHLTSVKFSGYEPGDPPVTITADTARLTSKGDEVFLYGNVVMVRAAAGKQSEITVKTTYMHVIPDARLASTDKPVTVEDADTRILAEGMVVDDKARSLAFTKVRATYFGKKR